MKTIETYIAQMLETFKSRKTILEIHLFFEISFFNFLNLFKAYNQTINDDITK